LLLVVRSNSDDARFRLRGLSALRREFAARFLSDAASGTSSRTEPRRRA